MDLTEIRSVPVVELVQNRVQVREFMNTAVNL